MMNIAFAGSLSLQDFRRAQAVDGRTRVMIVFMTVFVVFIVVSQTFLYVLSPSIGGLVAILPGVILGAFFLIMMRLQITRIWKKQQAAFATISGLITDDAVTYNTALSDSTCRWAMFQKYKIAPDMILLYQNTNAFNMFPRHLFKNDGDWNAFIQLVQQKIVDASRGHVPQRP